MMFKRKKTVFLVLALVLILISTAIISYHLTKKSTNYITAKEGLVRTTEILGEKYGDDIWYLSYVIKSGSIDSEGRSACWTYYITVNTTSGYEGLMLKIYYNGNYEMFGPGVSSEPPSFYITNWTIDSDEAYSIAMKNEKIRAFLDKYPDAEVDSFSLSSSGNSSHPVWRIAWVDWGFWDDPHWAKIQIDATTGEVLYAEANIGAAMNARTIYTLCIAFVVLLIVIIVAVIIGISKMIDKKVEEKEEKKKYARMIEKDMREWDERHGKL